MCGGGFEVARWNSYLTTSLQRCGHIIESGNAMLRQPPGEWTLPRIWNDATNRHVPSTLHLGDMVMLLPRGGHVPKTWHMECPSHVVTTQRPQHRKWQCYGCDYVLENGHWHVNGMWQMPPNAMFPQRGILCWAYTHVCTPTHVHITLIHFNLDYFILG